jgi:hypothetical protein
MNQTPVQLQADLMADTVAFPVLSAAELAECTEFGTRCSFAQGEEIFGAGSQSFDCYVIVLGDVCIMDVSTDEPTCIVRLGAGQFTGDIDLFTCRNGLSGDETSPCGPSSKHPKIQVFMEHSWRISPRSSLSG